MLTCGYDGSPCFIPGFPYYFRIVESYNMQCIINDNPCDKYRGCSGLDDLLIVGPLGGSIGDITCVGLDFDCQASVAPVVPLPDALSLMACVVMAFVGLRYSKPFGEWFTRERGMNEGQNGWL